MDTLSRVKSKITISNTHWFWDGAKDQDGYGRIRTGTKVVSVARALWEDLYQPIPRGLCVSTNCGEKFCVNPDHLIVATRRDIVLKGDTVAARNYKRKACKNGHKYTPESTSWYRGERVCKICRNERSRYARLKRNLETIEQP